MAEGKAKVSTVWKSVGTAEVEGRVKDITIGGSYSSAKIKELVKENYAGLAAVDLNR